jgi:chromosome segregation ATPase
MGKDTKIAWDAWLGELGPAMARWADGALSFIEDLERDLDATQEALGKSEQARNALSEELQKTKATLAATEQDFGRIREALGRERDHGVTLAQKHAREIDLLRRDLADMGRDLARTQGERDAWRVAAESSRSALDTLAAAVRVPVAERASVPRSAGPAEDGVLVPTLTPPKTPNPPAPLKR